MTRRDGLLYYHNTNNCPKYFAYVCLLVYDVTLAYQEFEFMTDDVIDLLSESESSEEGKPSLNALRTSCMKSIISIAKVDEARYAAARTKGFVLGETQDMVKYLAPAGPTNF